MSVRAAPPSPLSDLPWLGAPPSTHSVPSIGKQSSHTTYGLQAGLQADTLYANTCARVSCPFGMSYVPAQLSIPAGWPTHLPSHSASPPCPKLAKQTLRSHPTPLHVPFIPSVQSASTLVGSTSRAGGSLPVSLHFLRPHPWPSHVSFLINSLL